MNHTFSPLCTPTPLTRKAFALFVLALGLTGCGTGTLATSGGDPLNTGGVMAGRIYGGNQPIVGATVQLYTVGNTGYGSPGTLYATATTDGNGGFQFTQTTPGTTINSTSSTYGCPTASDPQVYLVATGGNPGGGTNTYAASIAAIGKCSTVASVFVNMNEVVSVATMAAVQQYFNPSQTIAGTTYVDSIGSPNTTQAKLGLDNAVATISNMVNINNGVAYSTYGVIGSVPGVNMTATPEQAKINLIANILAACINSTGIPASPTGSEPCSILKANAVPQNAAYTSQPGATFVAATDSVQALYYMFTNPTQSQDNGATGKLHNLFSLAAPQSPFATTLTQPLDWTIGINYYPGTSSKCTATTGNVFFSPTMKSIAVDAKGNIWFNGGSSGTSNAFGELSPVGAPLACPNTVVGGVGLTLGLGLAIDTTGNVYSATASQIYEVPATGTPFFWPVTSLSGMAVDPSGNLFYVPSTATAIQEFVGASTKSAPTSSVSVGPAIGTAGTFLYVATDQNGRLFADANTGSNLPHLFPDTGSHAVNGYYQANIGASSFQSGSYGIAVDSAGSIFGGNTCCAGALNNTLWKLTVTDPPAATDTTAPTVTATQSVKYLGGIVAPRGQAIDGAGNVWIGMADPVLNAAQSPSGNDVYAVAEVSNDLTTGISPNGVTPSTCSSTGPNCQTNGGFQKAALSVGINLAIDPSGNVWTIAQSNPGSIVEIVGQAVPTVTPIVAGQGLKP